MARTDKKSASSTPKKQMPPRQELTGPFLAALQSLIGKTDGFIFPLIIPPLGSIDEDALFDVYPALRKVGRRPKLHVLLYSYGGDAHTAFHIGRLLQDYATEQLHVYVLREAKSAATLLACAGEKIIFTEMSELGPMDPQVIEGDSDRRFSPLAIKHALDLLADQSAANHQEIVKVLAEKLPRPLVLGEHLKSLETGKDYLFKLLRARMFRDEGEDKARGIAERLVMGYPDHGYCIDFREAQDIGLVVERAPDGIADELFDVMRQYKSAWDQFMALIRSDKEADRTEAMHIYTTLKGCAERIITQQVEAPQGGPEDAPAVPIVPNGQERD